MKQKATYLKITIHDNDFIISLMYVGDLLYKIFQNEGRYPTEEDLPYLKERIKYIWCGIHATNRLMRWGTEYAKEDYEISHLEYFEPILSFVDYLDIPNWENSECIYIPMFDTDTEYQNPILVR